MITAPQTFLSRGTSFAVAERASEVGAYPTLHGPLSQTSRSLRGNLHKPDLVKFDENQLNLFSGFKRPVEKAVLMLKQWASRVPLH